MIDFISDYIETIIVVLMIVCLIFIVHFQENEKNKCKKEGGVVINRYMGYDCLTKEDFKKLRSDK